MHAAAASVAGIETTPRSDPLPAPAAFADADSQPGERAEQGELLAAVRDCVARELTPHQRQVLIALAIEGVPIDVLAERLTPTRGALYKPLHDARRRLRARLAERGFDV